MVYKQTIYYHSNINIVLTRSILIYINVSLQCERKQNERDWNEVDENYDGERSQKKRPARSFKYGW